MAGYLMQKGNVDAVVVGCDRVAANGDVANKIGTYSSPCWRSGMVFHFMSPGRPLPSTSTARRERRFPSSSAIRKKCRIFLAERWRPKESRIFNPAFDVTAQDLISAIITEKGVIHPPYLQNIRNHVGH